jgi:hypothetical protein
MKNFILFAFTFFCFDSKAQQQVNEMPTGKPGSCYGKYMVDSTNQAFRWEEILCGNKMTPQVIQKISKELNYKGYKIDVFNEILDDKLRDMIRKYQKENNLPIGGLNIKTLEALGISY